MPIAYFLEIIYHLFQVEPFLTRTEVLKVGYTHYFSIDKAKRDFGYQPLISSENGMAKVAACYSLTTLESKDYFKVVGMIW